MTTNSTLLRLISVYIFFLKKKKSLDMGGIIDRLLCKKLFTVTLYAIVMLSLTTIAMYLFPVVCRLANRIVVSESTESNLQHSQSEVMAQYPPQQLVQHQAQDNVYVQYPRPNEISQDNLHMQYPQSNIGSQVNLDVQPVEPNRIQEPVYHQSSRDKVILFTQSRSGSSFIGKMLEHRPMTFYSFEPLRFLEFNAKEDILVHDILLGKNVSLFLSNMLDCNLAPLESASIKYFPDKEDARKNWIPTSFPGHHSFQAAMSDCLLKKNVAIKIIRVKYLKYIIPTLTDRQITIIQLVRDPRGRFSSLLKLKMKAYERQISPKDFMNNALLDELKNDVRAHCRMLGTNYMYLNQLKISAYKPSGNFLLVRYEDFAHKPKEMATKLLNYLGEQPTESFMTWLEGISTTELENKPYLPVRNSTKTAEEWREFLPFHIVQIIQEECRPVFRQFGYKIADSQKQLKDFSQSLVGTITENLPHL